MEFTPAQIVAAINDLIDRSSLAPTKQNLYHALAIRQWLDAIASGELILSKPAPAKDVPKE
jgi:hypothetical protein